MAYAMAMRIITRRADLASDCLGVVRKGTGTLRKAISPAAKFAGVVLDTHRWPFQRERVALRWVPAHRKETGEEDLTVRRDIRGNSLADELAKEAVARHEAFLETLKRRIEWHEARAGYVPKAIWGRLGQVSSGAWQSGKRHGGGQGGLEEEGESWA